MSKIIIEKTIEKEINKLSEGFCLGIHILADLTSDAYILRIRIPNNKYLITKITKQELNDANYVIEMGVFMVIPHLKPYLVNNAIDEVLNES